MTNRVQANRSSVSGNVPAAGTRQPGELWVNWPDKQLGTIDASKTAQPMVAVRFFSTGANYAVGAYVVQSGQLYRAKVAVTAGAFNPSQWTLTGGSVLVSQTAPPNPTSGDMWFDSAGGQLYVFYDDGNSQQWVIAVNQTTGGGLYLPLTGGTLTGDLTVNGGVTAQVLIARANTGSATLQFLDNTGAPESAVYWDNTDSHVGFYNNTGYGQFGIYSDGSSRASGIIKSGVGYQCKAGTAGAFSNVFNIHWAPPAHLWIDATDQGAIAYTSDYRTKKDVADLDSMWETAKALRPIRYTQAEYHPPGAVRHDNEDGEPMPMFPADDEERWGFIAHELQETLIPSAANGVKDQPDVIQSPNPWTVIATLTKALQEAMARIEALEAGAV